MVDALLQGLWKALKAGLIAAVAWTCAFSAILWFFSKPTIPYINFVTVLAPYSLAFFGGASLIFEYLTHSLEKDREAARSRLFQ